MDSRLRGNDINMQTITAVIPAKNEEKILRDVSPVFRGVTRFSLSQQGQIKQQRSPVDLERKSWKKTNLIMMILRMFKKI